MIKQSLNIKVTDGNVERTFPYMKNNDGSFASSLQPAVISTYEYHAERMGSAPTITATFEYPLCLDSFWTKEEYVTFNGERYFAFNTPSSSKSEESVMFKHEVTFMSARAVLDQTLFLDVVTDSSPEDYQDRVCSNNTKLTFYGDIFELVARLNDALIKQGLCTVRNQDQTKTYEGYHIVINDGVTSDEKELSFDSSYFTAALQEISNTFGLSYYFVGKVIHVGEYEHQIPTPISYGQDNGLLSIEHTNPNDMIVRQITGMGSSENIPYYYPNDTPDGKLLYTRKNADESEPQWDITAWSLSKLNGNGIGVFDSPTLTWGEAHLEKTITLKIADDINANISGGSYNSENDLSSTHEYISGESNSFTWNMKTCFVCEIPISVDEQEGYSVNQKYNINLPVKFRLVTADNYGTRSLKILRNKFFKITDQAGQDVSSLFNITGNPNGNNGWWLIEDETTYPFTISLKDKQKGIENYYIRFQIAVNATNTYIGQNGVFIDDMEDRGTLSIEDNVKGFVFHERLIPYHKTGITLNDTSKISRGDSLTIDGLLWIPPMQKLMPSIYRESWGTERFYKALNIDENNHNQGYTDIYGTNIDKNKTYKQQDGTYYTFDNVWNNITQGQAKEDFDDIRPSIKGMVNGAGERMDAIKGVAFDNNDDDSKTSDTNGSNETYVHPYFYIKLPKLDFNLFDQALEGEAGYIEMTSGKCGACRFEIATLKIEKEDRTGYKFYNPVLLDGNGDLLVGDYKTMTTSYLDELQLEQYTDGTENLNYNQDSSKKEIWIAVKKDIDTFGVIIPNQKNRYRPENGDTYVFTGIKMPSSYIKQAEHRLDAALMDYMKKNNDEHFKFSIRYSRIWLEEHSSYANLLNENAYLPVIYNNTEYNLFVQSCTIKVDESILSEIEVDVSTTLTVGQSGISQIADAVSKTIVSKGAQSTPQGGAQSTVPTTQNVVTQEELAQEAALRQQTDLTLSSRITTLSNSFTALSDAGYKFIGAYYLDDTYISKATGKISITLAEELLSQKVVLYAFLATTHAVVDGQGNILLEIVNNADPDHPLFDVSISQFGNIIAINKGSFSDIDSFIGFEAQTFGHLWAMNSLNLIIGKAIGDANGNNIENTYAKKADIVGVYKYKGSVATYNQLPTTGLTIGDVYDVRDNGMNYGWTGSTWDALGMEIQIDYPITDVRVNGNSVVANKVANIPVPTALSGLTNDLVAIEPYPSTLYNNIRNDIDALFSN
jgi:hypothetical protein